MAVCKSKAEVGLTLFLLCSIEAAGFVSRQEALIRSVDYIKLRRWLDQVRSELPLSDAIDIITARMRTANDEVHHILAGALADLWSLAGRDDEALQVLGETMACYPDDVRPAISKATKYLYALKNPEEALRCIDVALERAYRTLPGLIRKDVLDRYNVFRPKRAGDSTADEPPEFEHPDDAE